MTYQKKALPVKAVEWTGINDAEVKKMIVTGGGRAYFDHQGSVLITTFDGDRTARPGFWIVLEPEGRFFCGDSKWFHQNYEARKERSSEK